MQVSLQVFRHFDHILTMSKILSFAMSLAKMEQTLKKKQTPHEAVQKHLPRRVNPRSEHIPFALSTRNAGNKRTPADRNVCVCVEVGFSGPTGG